MYLRPRGNIYVMRLISPAEMDPSNNYTLSREGVSHFSTSGCDFTPLEQFEREFNLYQRILHVSSSLCCLSRGMCA